MIPKIIHQVWIGPDAPPTKWMDSFDALSEHGWEHWWWTEEGIEEFGLVNQKTYDYYMGVGRYFGAADIVRSEVIERYGGWYFDADCELLEPELFANHVMHEGGFVVGNTKQAGPYPKRLPNTVYGAVPWHPISVKYVEIITEMTEANNLEPAWNTVGGTALTMAIDAVGRDQVTIMPMCTFYPEVTRIRSVIDAPVLSRHHWASSYKTWEMGREG